MRHALVPGLVCLALTLTLGCPAADGEETPGSSEGEGSSTAAVDSTGTIGEETVGTTVSVDESSGGSSTGEPLPEPLPPLEAVPTTVDATIVPTHALETNPVLDPRIPEELAQLLGDGYGAYAFGPGEPVLPLTPDGSEPPALGGAPSLLARFMHLCDTQIADDESPMRVALVDNPFIAGAFRPQETHGCQTTNAAVRTINAVHAEAPLDFVVLGGDNADSAQSNEVQWFLDVLDGAPVVHCDSGQDDDPVPGDGNDPKDRFAPVGLDVPWIWVSGNHDALVQGNFEVNDQRKAAAIGAEVPPGGSTRDWSQPGGPVFQGPVVADEGRALTDAATLLELVMASGDGHGITDDTIASGRATFAWDLPGTPLRMVVVDSTGPAGGSEGLVTDDDVAELIRPRLDQAEADGKLVMIATHHASTSLGDGSGLGGDPIPGALTTDDWQALLADYPSVIAHLCGHSHEHRVSFVQPLGTRGYWEIITAAIADWPHQMRIVELHDQGDGWLTITGIALDLSVDDDPLGTDAKGLGILDYTSGWQLEGAGMPADRNVQLWIPAP
jgi:Calcineurin-like phosphoesterase